MRRSDRLIRWLGTAALGAAVALGQAPVGWWPVAILALSGVTWAVVRSHHPARAAWLAGAGYFAAAMFWIVEPFQVEPEKYGWMAPFALIGMAGGMALFWALAGWIAGRSRPRALGFALGLAATDLLRGYVLTGFPWALTGHVFIGSPIAQAAAFVGPVGLSLIATLTAAAPWMTARRRSAAALAVLVLALVWGGGQVRLSGPGPADRADLRVRLIQPNAQQDEKWNPDRAYEFFDRQRAQTSAPPRDGGRRPDLVIWPETAVPWLLDDPGPVLELIAESAGGARVALGIQRSDGPLFYNSLAVLGPGAEIEAVYDKFHLVPFGEYVPLGEALVPLGVSAFAASRGNYYSAGPGARVLDLGRLGKVQPLICYEAVFPQDLRAAPERPDWLMQVTNDAWFGQMSGPYQHLAQARLRAIESGLPLLRAANTGITAVIDAQGRIRQSLALGAEGWIDTAVPGALPPTPYARLGDLPVAAGLIVAFLALFLRSRARRIDPGPVRP